MDSLAGRQTWRPFITLFLLACSFLYLLYDGGGVYPSFRAIGFAGVALAATVFQGTRDRTKRAIPLRRAIRLPAWILLGFVSAQILPLPYRLMRLINPDRAFAMQQISFLSGTSHWAPLSVDVPASRLEVLTVLGCTLTFALVYRMAAAFEHRWLLTTPLLFAAILEALLGWLQAHNPTGPAVATGTFLNRNHFAGFLEMMLPLTLAGSWVLSQSGFSRPWIRIAAATLLALSGLLIFDAVLLTYSRMGLVVVCAVLWIVLCLALFSAVHRSRRTAWMLLSATAFVLVLGTALAPERLVSRLEGNSSIDRTSTELRIGISKDSLPLLWRYRFWGSGLGTFESVFTRSQVSGTIYRVEYAHNDFLQAAIELGSPAFLLAFWLVLMIVGELWRTIRRSQNSAERLLRIACLSSLAGLLLHSLVDFNLHIPVNAMACAWIVGIGLSGRSRPNTKPS